MSLSSLRVRLDGPEMAPEGPKGAQDGPRRVPGKGPDGLKTARVGSKPRREAVEVRREIWSEAGPETRKKASKKAS